MVAVSLASYAAMAAALFVTELTDKDAFLLIAVSTRVKPLVVFGAGVAAFTATTALFVTGGSVLVRVVPVQWIRLAGGAAMVAYGLWEARGLVGVGSVEEERSAVEKTTTSLRAFFALVGALAVLDIAGDATEVLTIVFAGQFGNAPLVFGACLTGLVAATGAETILGNRLGGLLTPRRLQYISTVVFLALGASIFALNLY